VLLDAFVIPRSYSTVYSSSAADSSGSDTSTSENTDSVSAEATAYASVKKVVTDNSYKDENINIQITQYRENDTDIYVADITVSSADYLKTAFAQDTYGKNITAKSSTIAGDNNAILAINGDYYGTRDGYVIRNGVLYRETSAGSTQQDLVIGSDGSFSFITEGTVTAQELLNNGAWQVLSFGPALITQYTGLPESAGNIVSLWRCGIATLTTGSCLQGIFEIYGSAASLVQIYWIAGFSLLAASGILCLIHFQSDKRKNHSVHDRMKTDI
jgi:hypothetical protein